MLLATLVAVSLFPSRNKIRADFIGRIKEWNVCVFLFLMLQMFWHVTLSRCKNTYGGFEGLSYLVIEIEEVQGD